MNDCYIQVVHPHFGSELCKKNNYFATQSPTHPLNVRLRKLQLPKPIPQS